MSKEEKIKKSFSTPLIIIGSGNVATQLARAFTKKNIQIAQVFSPNITHAEKLASLANCSFTNNIKEILQGNYIYLVCIKDEAIKAFAKSFKINEGIILHTSGSIAMDVLKNSAKNYGVFYPLQSISSTRKLSFKYVPICIEASNKETLQIIEQLANYISKNIHVVTSVQRKKIHLAAVIVNNFTNHLYHLAFEYLKKEKISPELLYMLIEETTAKALELSPFQAQTGPAKRKDKETIMAHKELLKKNPDLQNIYNLLTESIIKTYHHE
ncbi:MAG: hypothetical protein KatS3mg035_0412 [Bacteroidia bacterium]|nr:MAG: hypothetical protein KatS3mg035_0412 [Bacteroidia bacterium]